MSSLPQGPYPASTNLEPAGAAVYSVEVKDLVKEFRVYHRTYGTLKSKMIARANEAFGRGDPTDSRGFELRRALDGISFKIRKGEAVGLVGRNGSGKSTLLSILSRIYLPTSGEARLHGKLMSLLELGAGFHAELTGLDNLMFTGAMMGVPEAEMRRRYERILEFSELDRSIMDLPVRMYSSGMQMRLAFSNAVHMDADILIVDEALSVGDEGFMRKAADKMEQFRDEGKTIVLVSHILSQIERLADRVIWLQGGKIVADGTVADVLPEYRSTFKEEPPA